MFVHVDAETLEQGLEEVLRAPASVGTVELVVRRPAEDEREILEEGVLDPAEGLVGDDWLARNARRGREANPDTQLTLVSSRVLRLLAAEDHERWALAGDQLYVDLDLRPENLPAGTRLEVGSAVVEVTSQLHTGCAKYTERFGHAAIRFVNAPRGRSLRLRGMYARVVERGTVRPGDTIRKL